MEADSRLQAYRRMVTREGFEGVTEWHGKGKFVDGRLFVGRIRFDWDGTDLKSETKATAGDVKICWNSEYSEHSDPSSALWASQSDTGAFARGSLARVSLGPDHFTWEILTWSEDPQKGKRLKETVTRKTDDTLKMKIESEVDGSWQPLLNTTLHRKTG